MKRTKKVSAAARERQIERLAVRIVSAVSRRMTGRQLFAYDGIEASRAVRHILLRSSLLKRG